VSGGAEIALVFGLFLVLLCGGLWVPFAIGVTAVVYLLSHLGAAGLRAIGLVTWGSMNSFTLTAVPLFILLAQIMEKSGLSFRIYRGLSHLVRGVPGGLLQTNIIGCALFAAISGSSVATAAAIGSVALPQLLQRNYDRRLSAGSLAAGGTLGILMPPSIALIIYGTFTETSIAKLFMAGIVPGLLMAGLFMVYILIHALVRRGVAPTEPAPHSLREVLGAVWDLVPFVLLIGGTLGSIYFGIVTPTEAAAVGCVFAVIVSAIWGQLSWRGLRDSIVACVNISGNILFIVYTAFLFAYAISMAGVGTRLTAFLVGLHLSRSLFFVALLALYTILGCLVESIGMIVITVPLLYPVILQYGIDPIWFGILLVLFIELGQITPPVGINLFVIQSIWSGKLSDVIAGTIPFHLIMFGMVAILIFWPQLALWLPAVMSQR
jgi:tripartite ATP-independent transporter DctM subunit